MLPTGFERTAHVEITRDYLHFSLPQVVTMHDPGDPTHFCASRRPPWSWLREVEWINIAL